MGILLSKFRFNFNAVQTLISRLHGDFCLRFGNLWHKNTLRENIFFETVDRSSRSIVMPKHKKKKKAKKKKKKREKCDKSGNCAEIRNFSSSVEKYFTSERSERVKYFST